MPGTARVAPQYCNPRTDVDSRVSDKKPHDSKRSNAPNLSLMEY